MRLKMTDDIQSSGIMDTRNFIISFIYPVLFIEICCLKTNSYGTPGTLKIYLTKYAKPKYTM